MPACCQYCSWIVCITFCFFLTSAYAFEESPPANQAQVLLNKIQQELANSPEPELTRLLAIDDELSQFRSPEVDQLRSKVMIEMARSGDEGALQYLRHQFESYPEIRDEAAHALAVNAIKSPKNLQDWRYLIRSLTVVEGEQAITVMEALTRYRQRSTNSKWTRYVIRQAASLPEDQRSVAIKLLKHWQGYEAPEELETLQDWQQWYRSKYPKEPSPMPLSHPEKAKWKYEDLVQKLDYTQFKEEEVELGKTVYEKANCSKCHLKGKLGENKGPNLSAIAALRQRKELIEATMFPNAELNEDYPTSTVITTSGTIHTGLMSILDESTVRILQADGKTVELKRTDIDQILASSQSNMPAGLLDPLSFEEIRALFAYLELREGKITNGHFD